MISFPLHPKVDALDNTCVESVFIYANGSGKKYLKDQIGVSFHIKLYEVKPQKFRYANMFDIGLCSTNIHRMTIYIIYGKQCGAEVHLCLANPF